jgi:selenocysteine lyase/cysteine desulfurase
MAGSYDVARIRKDFPILDRRLPGDLPLVYLDSANTSHKPDSVLTALDAMVDLERFVPVHASREDMRPLIGGAFRVGCIPESIPA